MNDRYLALIQGGEGPDVWDKEVFVSAVDFRDAANQTLAKAEELGGHVVSLEWSYTPPKPKLTPPVQYGFA